MGSQCIVKGCVNTKDYGGFVGDLCGACYNTIVTGKVNEGDTFIHRLYRKAEEQEAQIKSLSRELLNIQANPARERINSLEKEVEDLLVEIGELKMLEEYKATVGVT